MFINELSNVVERIEWSNLTNWVLFFNELKNVSWRIEKR